MVSRDTEWKVPNELYRFRSCQTDYFDIELAKLVTEGVHFFSPLTGANDPFDCNPVYERSSEKDIASLYKKLGKKYLVDPDNIRENFSSNFAMNRELKKNFVPNYKNIRRLRSNYDSMHDDIRNQSKIICLTPEYSNALMWAHYANSHNGIAIKFSVNTDRKIAAYDDIPLDVVYSDVRPRISTVDLLSWFNSEGADDEIQSAGDRAFNAFVLTKPKVWEYEREWRVQKRFPGSGDYKFVPALKLKEVIIGARVKEATIKSIERICAGRCKLSKASINQTKFELDVNSL